MPIEKIIMLEDDLIVRKSLEQQLRYRRYDVASASTIAGAQELLGKDNFDLMIVDVKLPDGDGTELLSATPAASGQTAGGDDLGFWNGGPGGGMHEQRAIHLPDQAVFPEQLAVTPQESGRAYSAAQSKPLPEPRGR
jgi:hypothetical protein